MQSLGKFLQALGLVIPLVGIFRAFSEEAASREGGRGIAMMELGMLALGVLLYLAGTALVRRGE